MVADPGVAVSDGGTWELSLPSAEWSTGWNDLDLRVSQIADGDHADGLELIVDVTMPSMGHGSSEDHTLTELGEGIYRVRVFFQMGGSWELTGTITDAELVESFALLADVVEE